MKIRSLRLHPFGEQRDSEIGEFRDGLNLIRADNEAGKSTLLRALRFGLYGGTVKEWQVWQLAEPCQVDLIFEREGRRWLLHRAGRRGRGTFSLTPVPAGGAIARETLEQEWLAGLREAQYQALYWLTLAEVDTCPDLDLLLLAETGDRGRVLRETQDHLEKQVAELFTRQAQKPLLNQALRDWSAATETVRALGQQPATLRQTQGDLAAAQALDQELRQACDTARRARDEARELQHARPNWLERLRLLRELEAYSIEVPTYDPETLRTYETATTKIEEKTSEHDKLDRERATAEEEQGRLRYDAALLDEADELRRLQRQRASLAKLPAQRQEAQAAAERHRREATQVAHERCGESLTLAQLTALDASRVIREERERLATALSQAEQREHQATGDQEKARLDHQQRLDRQHERDEALQAARDRLPAPEERQRWQEQTAAVTEAERLQERLTAAQLAVNERTANHEALRQQREQEVTARQQASQAAQEQQRSEQRAFGWGLVMIAVLVAGGGIWQLTAQATVPGGLSLGLGFGLLFMGGRLLIIESAIQLAAPAALPAFTITDAMLSHAQRELTEAHRSVAGLERQLADQAARARVDGDPGEAAAWHRLRQELTDQQNAWGEAAHAEGVADTAARTAADEVQGAAERLASAGQELNRARDALQQAHDAWHAWREARGLAPEYSPDQTRIALEAAAEIHRALAEARAQDQRAADAQRELETLRDGIQKLAGRLGRAMAAEDDWGFATLQAWDEELTSAEQADRRRQELTRSLDDLKARLEAVQQDLQAAGQAQREALATVGVIDVIDLYDLDRCHDEWRDLDAQLHQVTSALQGHRDEAAWQDWQQKLAATDWPNQAAKVGELNQQVEAQETALRDVQQTIARLEDAIEGLEQSDELAAASTAREIAATQIGQRAHDWLVRTAAATLIAETLRRHERERQPERIIRIGELFRELTAGRWQNILLRDRHLLAVRDNGDVERTTDQLSQGARNTLFLAARLAALEHRLDRCPLPVTLDDTLVNLDRQRRRAMLRTIHDVCCPATQVILFTCHEMVRDDLDDLNIPYQTVDLPGD